MTRDKTIAHYARQADEIGITARNGRYFNAAANLDFQTCTCGAEYVARRLGAHAIYVGVGSRSHDGKRVVSLGPKGCGQK
jgi:hypothetical protein